MLSLHIVPPQGEPFDHPLEGDSMVVGRSSDCQLVLADPFLSRQHARLFLSGEAWMVEDLGSRNGTLLNGHAVEEPAELKAGDRIQLSGSLISIREAGAEATEPAAVDFGAMSILRPVSELVTATDSVDVKSLEKPEELRRHADRLKILNEIHQALAGPITQQELLDLILSRAFESLKAEEGVIFLEKPDGEFERAAFRAVPGLDKPTFYSTTLIQKVAKEGQAALVMDITTDERFSAAQSMLSAGIRSLIAAPLADATGSLGMIALSSRISVRKYSEEDLELLATLGSVAALRIRNVALAVEAAERQRMEEEMQLARKIQVALLPDQLPDLAGWQLYAGNQPSRGASGDYYLITERDEGKECVLMVADVSGKGIAAALLTASLEALAAGLIETGRPPEEIFSRVSRRLHARTPAAKYATAILGVLEPSTGGLRWTNAGHNTGLIVRASGEVEHMASCGPPIGLLPVANYTFGEGELGPGDSLVFYSDGITEAQDPEDEEYGLERLEKVCVEHHQAGPDALSAELEKDLERFVKGTPYADDRTVVIIHRDPA